MQMCKHFAPYSRRQCQQRAAESSSHQQQQQSVNGEVRAVGAGRAAAWSGEAEGSGTGASVCIHFQVCPGSSVACVKFNKAQVAVWQRWLRWLLRYTG